LPQSHREPEEHSERPKREWLSGLTVKSDKVASSNYAGFFS
jgi:hypothetical protein